MAHFSTNGSETTVVGHSVGRKDTSLKVTGHAKYTDDEIESDMLHAALLTSPHAHARILSMDRRRALQAPGVRAVLFGTDCPNHTGDPLADRPILAIDTVRYAGEPVAIVIADEFHQAAAALASIDVVYAPLPVVQSPKAAYEPNAPLLHPDVHTYRRNRAEANPIPGTNIATHVPIRKGHPDDVWASCDVIAEVEVSFPQAHHAYMETPAIIAEIDPDGEMHITTSTQSPFTIPSLIHETFDVNPSQVRVHVPFVGGGFGGKSSPYLEPLVVAASKAVGGRKVKLRCEREHAMQTLPCHIGLEAKVRLGAKRDGRFVAVDITYWFDGGAYADRAVIVTRAAVQDCTGPYRIPHVRCDGFCMYTNHPPATAYRGFGHPEETFVIERAVDVLARQLHLDPLEIRRLNAIRTGDSTPTQTLLTGGRVGNVPGCIDHLKKLMEWDGRAVRREGSRIIAKGMCCSWKTSSTPPNASSGAIVRVNEDSTVTLLSGVVEIGQGTKTALAQMVAEVFAMSVDRVHVVLEVDTKEEPEHWKTVASRGTLLAGNAAVRAAIDAVRQLQETAAIVFQCRPSDVRISNGVASCAHEEKAIPIGDFKNGYAFPDGRSVGRMVIGRGSYTIEDVTPLDPETGRGSPGPEWTVAAQGVEIEYRPADCTYRVLRAFSVIDAGKVIHPALALGQVKGAMNMGLSLASREGYVYSGRGVVTNPQFRVYPIHRYGDQPEYHVVFLETPDEHAPWGLRGLGEHGLIGMPAALASALSNALGVDVNEMPMTSELLWRIQTGG
ncbi:xanthine dehydrogenase family protein molybdopterin-binding subunit [Alicyclobacillus acidiphilus]|uniref:xanthine dehydrogenase family protein molybdopterin-binding subunit n=1 Tax=Alicyclobacillus acidiphilus TaxID=182455 RepID=UPI00082DBC9E|nr:xanthine dehydrogenase family protein molybdopterin-binding subunit [Alicyclobacillus acidiphilus]